MGFHKRVRSAKNWVDAMLGVKGRVHYTELAFGMGVSPSMARMVLKALAEVYADEYEYRSGYIYRKVSKP